MSPLFAASAGAVVTVWAVSLAIGAVVLLVVAFLLHQILTTAGAIERGASAIWTQGKLVANNTIQIPIFLHTTRLVTAQIRDGAPDIAAAAQGIEQHAEGCPGCPACVIDAHR